MKKEQKFEQKQNSYSTADNLRFQPTCPKPIVKRSVCGWHQEPIIGHYYMECPKCGFLRIEVKQTDA